MVWGRNYHILDHSTDYKQSPCDHHNFFPIACGLLRHSLLPTAVPYQHSVGLHHAGPCLVSGRQHSGYDRLSYQLQLGQIEPIGQTKYGRTQAEQKVRFCFLKKLALALTIFSPWITTTLSKSIRKVCIMNCNNICPV